MIRDIEDGKINCVIFKDNSRLGRNYPELGRLMEEYFPQKGIRVISVLNYIDSLKDPHGYSSAMVSFSNIMNDDYIRQLSIKIKSTFAMKRECGEFLGNQAPYGYRKDPENRHRLIVDPEAAEIVRLIFNWYVSGMPASRIVKQLNALQIMPPSVYKTSKGFRGFTQRSGGGVKHSAWALTTVNSMLRNEVYIGNLVQGRYKSVSYRSKKTVPVDESEWTVVEGAHEAIISDEMFEIVHARLARHPRGQKKQQTSYALSGFVRCAHCGGRMNRNVSHGIARFRCMTRIYAPEKCQCPTIRETVLEAAVLESVQEQIRDLAGAKAVIEKARHGRIGECSINEYLLALNRAEREKARLEDAKFHLYDNLEKGVIDQDEYTRFKKKYIAEIAERAEQIGRLRSCMAELKEARQQDDEFVSFFVKYGNISRIDRETLERVLDHVSVEDDSHIHIFFKFSSERKKALGFAENIEGDMET